MDAKLGDWDSHDLWLFINVKQKEIKEIVFLIISNKLVAFLISFGILKSLNISTPYTM